MSETHIASHDVVEATAKVATERPVTFRNAGAVPEQTAEHARAMIRAAAAQTSWAEVALAAELPKRTVWAFAVRGYEPRKPSIRRALGLPVDPIPQVEMRVCSCGCGQAFYGATWNQKTIHGHPRRRQS